jgi:hypothetical protein
MGAAPGTLILHEQGPMSTLLNRTSLTAKPVLREYEVPVRILDSVVAGIEPDQKIEVKLDTEGYESEIVRGMTESAQRLDFLICEISVMNRFEGSYDFSELVAELSVLGLRFYNFLNIPRARPRKCYDCMFLQRDDPFFSTWSSQR